jgi:hypothetical protein
MKKLTLVIAALLIASATAFADATEGPFPITASVNSMLELVANVFDGDITAGEAPVPGNALNFGALIAKGDGTLGASKHFTVLLSAQSSSRKYAIKQTSTPLTAGAVTIPSGATNVQPTSNGAALPAGAVLGTAGTWVASEKVLYTSEAAGSARTVAAIYSVGGDVGGPTGATQVIPTGQAGGSYASSVTFTLVLA